MRTKSYTLPISCRPYTAQKAKPSIEHLAKSNHCKAEVRCWESKNRLHVVVTCGNAAQNRAFRRGIMREALLLKTHGLFGRKRR